MVSGVTYGPPKNNPHGKGNGLHDEHMNSGTDPRNAHAHDDRVHQDGALAFPFNLGDGRDFAHWVFIKFTTQTVVNL